MNPIFFERSLVWLAAAMVLLALCTYLPIRIKNDALRNWVMRWVLVPVSIIIIAYVYPMGIEVFRRLATR
jgi:hypothetical protein